MGGAGLLRPVDLGRIAGVSAQQVRNYVDAGVVPEPVWTAAGHRRFGEGHVRALVAYRGLAAGFGWDRAREVMRAVGAGEVAGALALVDGGYAALHGERVALAAAGEALAAVAGQEVEGAQGPRAGLRIGEVAARLGVRTSALRLWEAEGLLVPGREAATGYRVFGAADVRDARMVALLRGSGYRVEQIRPVVEGLRRTGSSAELRAAIAAREAEVGRRSRLAVAGVARLDAYLSWVEGEGGSAAHPLTSGSA
ncbi:MerR family transcriptional regulator [Nocardiopsis trehalosi]|uniref:MerR family transcriptional regulator n=1 Tax=Nocardiopsis trehalosi TaxID=109329 RepID=UPI000829CB64|nr:MerR family transcriptional regulator [Nocardiopsis trehalosi]